MRSSSIFLMPLLAGALALSACMGGSAPPPATSAAPARAAAPVWRDLNGARASSGESELQRRGFELSGQRGLTAFWNHAPSQTCLRVVTSDGRYAVSQVPFMPNCPL